MRTLILKMSMSIDGFVGAPNGDLGWVFANRSDESTRWIVDSISRAGVHIMGSTTFRAMAAHWPTATDAFARPMNEIPKVVFSRSGTPLVSDAVTSPTWTNARVASGPLADEIAQLKRESGGPIIAHGGASFAQSLVREGLIDQYELVVHPVALGRGLPLFSTLGDPRRLELVDLTRFKTGALGVVYTPR